MIDSGVAFLRTVSAFRSLPTEELERVCTACEELTYEPGNSIVRRGEPGDAMYIVMRGHVSVRVIQGRGERNWEAQLGPTEIFGEMALLTGEPRNSDVIARDDCVCLRLKNEAFQELLSRNLAVARVLTEILGSRLLAGDLIRRVGRYRLVGELGRGAASSVFEGEHELLGNRVAIKMLSHDLVYDARFKGRFQAESRIMAELRHANIVRVIDYEPAYATFFIIMEKVDGDDLRRVMTRRGILPAAEVRPILRQVLEGLDHAHGRGIVHRDVKPGNILVDPSGVAKVTDFGIARASNEEMNDGSGASGTPRYISPEQAVGEEADGRSDLYSLGIVAFEMVTGFAPFGSDLTSELLRRHIHDPLPSLDEFAPDLPADLRHFIDKATQKNRDDRFRSAREVLDLLDGTIDLDPSRVRRRTISVVYDVEQERKIDNLIGKWKKQAEKVKGTRFRDE